MIVVDTSSFVAYLSGAKGDDVDAVDDALFHKQVVLAPMVLTELLGDPKLTKKVSSFLLELPLLGITDGFWERAGKLRSKILAKKLKARLADSLIAQICIDHHVPLITRDHDFRHFIQEAKLKVAP